MLTIWLHSPKSWENGFTANYARHQHLNKMESPLSCPSPERGRGGEGVCLPSTSALRAFLLTLALWQPAKLPSHFPLIVRTSSSVIGYWALIHSWLCHHMPWALVKLTEQTASPTILCSVLTLDPFSPSQQDEEKHGIRGQTTLDSN